MYEHASKDFAEHGITIDGNIKVDITKMMQNKSKAVTGLTGGIEYLFKKYKVFIIPLLHHLFITIVCSTMFACIVGGLCQGMG